MPYLGLGIDPGKQNCAYSLWHSRDGLQDTDVLEGLREIGDLADFTARMRRVLKWYKPQVCAVERYQLRRGKGFVGNMELVNIMIGTIAGLCHDRKIPVYLVLPSVHKTWAGKCCGAVKRKGTLCMHTVPEFAHLGTEHEADASNVIRYCMEKLHTEE